MSKFKVGQVVTDGQGGRYVVSSVQLRGVSLEGHGSTVYEDSLFVSSDTKGEHDYHFKVGHEDLIEGLSFNDEVTRENPLLIAGRSDGLYTFVVHKSIMARAKLVDPALYYELDVILSQCSTYSGWVPKDMLTGLYSAVKAIKDAPLMDEHKLTVTVRLPRM